jgi:hypothetical protein
LCSEHESVWKKLIFAFNFTKKHFSQKNLLRFVEAENTKKSLKMADSSSPLLKNSSKSAIKYFCFLLTVIFRKDQILLKKKYLDYKSKMAAENQNGGKSAISYCKID